jgi:hypothetical protein
LLVSIGADFNFFFSILSLEQVERVVTRMWEAQEKNPTKHMMSL